MSQGKYATRQNMPGPQAGHMVVESATGRILGGFGHNQERAWTFPLNTPRGLNVVQEYAYDHAFHNGVFVGQGKVLLNGKESNFWAPRRDWRQPTNPIYQHIGILRYGEPPEITELPTGFRFTCKTTWLAEDESPVLDELRTVAIYDADDAVICDVASRKTAAYGKIVFAANKHGTVGVRVQPQLLPPFGGEILTSVDGGEIRRGRADEVASLKPCDFVAYEAEPHGLWRFGVCLSILANSAGDDRQGTWFIRDYGMAMYNPTMNEDITVAEGESWLAALRVAAYDGPLTVDRAGKWTA